jgi:hypothetical protein
MLPSGDTLQNVLLCVQKHTVCHKLRMMGARQTDHFRDATKMMPSTEESSVAQ